MALRRRESHQWGDSLCSVLQARGQFALSTTSKNYLFTDVDSWRQAWVVAGAAIDIWCKAYTADVARLIPHVSTVIDADPVWAVPKHLERVELDL